ncbi:MAG: 2Fe-2S iron-sulfur cluster-binding protein [Planctomycetota bacterium]
MEQSTPKEMHPPPRTIDPGADRHSPEPRDAELSRRGFLKGTGLTVASMGLLGSAVQAVTAKPGDAPATPDPAPVLGPGDVDIELVVNGEVRQAKAPPATTLLDFCRDRLDLTGAKRVCDRGSCGACSMRVDGVLVNSCTFLAVDAIGRSVQTIEGLSVGNELTPLQAAFVECDALQCGFCTPGMVMACTALLERNPRPTRAEVAEGIAGNICRCATYPNIFEAVARASGQSGR